MPVSIVLPPRVSRSTIAAQSRGVGEGLGPATEGLVGGDRDGVFLLAFGQHLEQQLDDDAANLFHDGRLPRRCPARGAGEPGVG